MKPHLPILLLCTALLAGCSSFTRLATGIVGAGTGALVGHKLGQGDPVAIAAGAGAGVLLSEGAHYAAGSAAERARVEGYNKGRSDAVKQQYWILVNQQKALADLNAAEDISLYEVPIPEQQIDGVTLQPTTRVLRIQE